MSRILITFVLVILITLTGLRFSASRVFAQDQIEIWWPAEYRILSGIQPFKGLLQNNKITDYEMFWQVDTGQPVRMYDSYADHPHKEAIVDFTNWNWKGSGPYTIKFTAKDKSGNSLTSKNVIICIKNACVSSTPSAASTNIPTPTRTPTPTSTPTPSPTPRPTTSPNPLNGVSFYTDPNSNAIKQYNSWRYSRPEDASDILKIAEEPVARWFGGWNSNITDAVDSYVTASSNAKSLPVVVVYNIPLRDCRGYSSGGASSPDAYRSWISSFARGINYRKTIVVLEPDSIANIGCLSPSDQQTRYDLLSYAVDKLKNAGAIVYLDAGHSSWINTKEMAARLKKAGIEKAHGFSLNVSNFINTQMNKDYGNSLSSLINGKHFIIDTGRNGLGSSPDGQWCNPSGRALGVKPTTSTGDSLIDAFLWIKPPGESDGNCNGAPGSGVWWPEYALGLAQRASY